MHNYPSRQNLITCFLQTHYAGRTAIVFCDVLGDYNTVQLKKLFNWVDMASIINSEVFIAPDLDMKFFSSLVKEEIYGYTMFWDGSEIVSENS
jgi:hypothetical protein